MKKKVVVSWSSGKDSAYMLGLLLQDPDYEVCALLTTFNEKFQRVAMHGVRETLVIEQAYQSGIPLWRINLPDNCDNEIYQNIMSQQIMKAKQCGITHMAFGDLFLEEIKTYRIKKLYNTGITPIFPLWKTPTSELAQLIINHNFKAMLTCVDSNQLSKNFVGSEFNSRLLAQLPTTVDPCGENGEFHTFVYAAPYFKKPINIQRGSIKEDDRFIFCDIYTRSD